MKRLFVLVMMIACFCGGFVIGDVLRTDKCVADMQDVRDHCLAAIKSLSK